MRGVAAFARKFEPPLAIARLNFLGEKGANYLAKVIKSAVANAKVAGVSDSDLTFESIEIGEGPRLKRGRPVSRGRWHPIKKRMCHIRVVLTTRNSQFVAGSERKPSTKLEEKLSSKNKKVKTEDIKQ